jgi:hypothetical protein
VRTVEAIETSKGTQQQNCALEVRGFIYCSLLGNKQRRDRCYEIIGAQVSTTVAA